MRRFVLPRLIVLPPGVSINCCRLGLRRLELRHLVLRGFGVSPPGPVRPGLGMLGSDFELSGIRGLRLGLRAHGSGVVSGGSGRLRTHDQHPHQRDGTGGPARRGGSGNVEE